MRDGGALAHVTDNRLTLSGTPQGFSAPGHAPPEHTRNTIGLLYTPGRLALEHLGSYLPEVAPPPAGPRAHEEAEQLEQHVHELARRGREPAERLLVHPAAWAEERAARGVGDGRVGAGRRGRRPVDSVEQRLGGAVPEEDEDCSRGGGGGGIAVMVAAGFEPSFQGVLAFMPSSSSGAAAARARRRHGAMAGGAAAPASSMA